MAGPLTVTLSDGQKLEALKRVRDHYQEELSVVENDLTEILTRCAEADFIAQYLGEQPEIAEMRARKSEAEAKEKRRQYLLKLIDRLSQVIPKQPELKPTLPTGGPAKGGSASGLRRY
ncbi:MAG: hypothetical protein AAB263_06095 [Planctomycetota bacterium]